MFSKHLLSLNILGIDWKKRSKKKSKRQYHSEWFNKFDKLSRAIKNDETNGILIGSHTSNLISEIILVNIDSKLQEKGYKFTRHIDDYACYVETYDKAEKFFLDLSIELKRFELSLNHKKSQILTLPFALTEHWIRKLNLFHFSDIKNEDGKVILKIGELKSFLDLAIDLMKTEKENSSILNYALRVISSKYLGKYAKDFYIKRLHHLVRIYPYLIPYVDELVFSQFKYKNEEIKYFLDDILSYGIEKNLPEMISYVLFMALKYDIVLNLDNTKEDKILQREDCISMLLLYLYIIKNYKKSRLTKAKNEIEKKARELNAIDFDRYWLFVYEVLPETDLKDDFARIKKQKISFIDKKVYSFIKLSSSEIPNYW